MIPYPWQTTQWAKLWAARQQERLPHALLLTGVRGLGKARFAEALAKAVLCEAQGESACDQCRSCHLFATASHPDFLSVGLLEKSKSIKVDQIRALNEALQKTAQDHYQVVLIHPAELMNRAAANALLKTLEEPPGNVLLMLVTDQLGYLPATIISRCQTIRFACAENDAVLTWLSRQLPSDLSPSQWLRMADYAPLHAITLAQENYLSLRDQLLTHLSQILLSGANPIAPVSDLLKQDLPTLLRAFMVIVRDLLCLSLNVGVSTVVNADRLPRLQALLPFLSSAVLLKLLDKLQESQQLVAGVTSVNTQLLLENILLSWMELKHAR